jgi:hypothetical protein
MHALARLQRVLGCMAPVNSLPGVESAGPSLASTKGAGAPPRRNSPQTGPLSSPGWRLWARSVLLSTWERRPRLTPALCNSLGEDAGARYECPPECQIKRPRRSGTGAATRERW